jgi:uncharacterized membrane protein YfcA
MASVMGVGGGLFVIPAMIYLLGMPTVLVVGTSLLQIAFVAAVAAFLHAGNNQTVDILLVLLLAVGSVIGSQYGVRVAMRLHAEYLRVLLAAVVLIVAGRLIYFLVGPLDEEFSFTFLGVF